MNQQKIGEFLKHLRKEQGLTQEQLAEAFYVSSRTVSRWETGSNMPDLEILIELADFYHVDIREIIDGERKSENMDNETKDTLKKVAEYAVEEKNLQRKPLYKATGWIAISLIFAVVLFARETKGLLNGIVSNDVCGIIMAICLIVAVATLVFQILLGRGVFDKLIDRKTRNRKNPC
ncbi:MAG: helix-turn-helix transcriptional regulator [Oscillospiraceae bacterium]|nr:helix-turn-helix transcriptional regulator [Oscillospiraceae bacterium]